MLPEAITAAKLKASRSDTFGEAVEELTVRGVTGVDITVRVAGPGTRSYAFVLDWHIRVLIGLGIVLLGLAAAELLPGGTGKIVARRPMEVAFILAGLTYVLYHPVLEVLLRGRTPGKRMAGARIVTVEGAIPGIGALLLRNLFRLIDSLPMMYIVGLSFCMFTARRVRIGDLVAGTVLVLDESAAAESLRRLGAALQRSPLHPEALKLAQDLLDRWSALEEEMRASLARSLLAKLGKAPGSEQLAAPTGESLRAMLEAVLAGDRS